MIVFEKEKELKKLWQEVFLDNKEFTDLFFEYFFDEGYLYKTEEDGKVLSCYYLLPMEVFLYSKYVKNAYLCGAATKKEYRGKGLMGNLLKKGLCDLYKNEVFFCNLIPSNEHLYSYYSNFGFSDVYSFKKYKFLKDESSISPCEIELIEEKNASYFLPFYKKELARHSLSLKRTAQFYEFLFKDSLITKKSKILKIVEHQNDVGYCFIENKLLKEYVYTGKDENGLFNEICKYLNSDITVCQSPFLAKGKDSLEKGGMIRIINAYEVLSIYAKKHKKRQMLFSIEDNIIKENNGTFKISGGIVYKTNIEPNFIVNIKDLPKMLFGDKCYINLLLN